MGYVLIQTACFHSPLWTVMHLPLTGVDQDWRGESGQWQNVFPGSRPESRFTPSVLIRPGCRYVTIWPFHRRDLELRVDEGPGIGTFSWFWIHHLFRFQQRRRGDEKQVSSILCLYSSTVLVFLYSRVCLKLLYWMSARNYFLNPHPHLCKL